MKQRIYFRADAGREIGYGHFIRTLALAEDRFRLTWRHSLPLLTRIRPYTPG